MAKREQSQLGKGMQTPADRKAYLTILTTKLDRTALGWWLEDLREILLVLYPEHPLRPDLGRLDHCYGEHPSPSR